MYATAANELRVGLFDVLLAGSEDPKGKTRTPEQQKQFLKDIGDLVSTWTGMSRMKSVRGIDKILWAPSMLKAAAKIITMTPLWTAKSWAARKVVLKQYTKLLTSLALIYGVASFFGQNVNWHPTSDDFGALRIGKKHTINPLSYVKPMIVFMARMLSGQKTLSTGEVINLRSKYLPFATEAERLRPVVTQRGTVMGTLGRFIQTKLHPWLGQLLGPITGLNFKGQEWTPTGALKEMTIPMTPRQITALFDKEDPLTAFALSPAVFFGARINEDYVSDIEQVTPETTALKDENNALKALQPAKEKQPPPTQEEQQRKLRKANFNLKYRTHVQKPQQPQR
jgi:hypothetical protein